MKGRRERGQATRTNTVHVEHLLIFVYLFRLRSLEEAPNRQLIFPVSHPDTRTFVR